MADMQPQYGFSQVAAGVYGRGATLEALTPGARVRSVVVGSAVTVISAQWHGSNAITLTYRDDAGSVAQTLLYRDVEPSLIVEQAARAYAFDGDPNLYRTVVEADGSAMTVRTALALINHALDEVLTEQEGDFDADTRSCVKWFTQFGWGETDFGHADQLSRSTNTSVDGLVRGGVFWARAGRARLLAPDDLSDGWNPLTDDRISVWEAVVRLGKTLDQQGGEEAARLMGAVAQRVDLDTAKELAYLLFAICEKKKWTETALLFNGLGTSWSDQTCPLSPALVVRAPHRRRSRHWSSPPGIRADNG